MSHRYEYDFPSRYIRIDGVRLNAIKLRIVGATSVAQNTPEQALFD
jgi:hypothetical protein